MTPVTDAEVVAIHAIIESSRALVLAADSEEDVDLALLISKHLERIDDLGKACAVAVDMAPPEQALTGAEWHAKHYAEGVLTLTIAVQKREIELLRAAIETFPGQTLLAAIDEELGRGP